ncbi:dihydrodipicolinate synthase family protein [Chitinophaga japonensis]|uniref:N-acetylneuraminate lyase n=1 Tax=Chitinophaga japonensis TaxID=104662 RepID=A0A562T187_CHIJA|nr:dihydrodipicolinate synthase family protein [Chitinophaga japonensis]TWI87033.1 N-acetylneuraminate lyase [Chitinophaga japonensis]
MRIEGLVAAIFTPFNENGSLNLAMAPILVEQLVNDGLTGIFVCGTNGEGPNMTIEERMEVAAAFVKAADKKLKVMVHVGHPTIAESQKLAAHAAQIGADAISAVAAFYFKPVSVGNLVNSMAAIAGAAPELPFYYYHIPVLTGVGMDMLEFLRLSEHVIPNLAGIKYTAPTLHEYQSCLQYEGGKYDILYGTDEMLLSAMAVGAKGAIGSTYSFAAPAYLQVMQLFGEGRLEDARQLQYRLVDMVRRFVKYPPLPAQKAIMQMTGLNTGPCRLPLTSLSAEQAAALKTDLEESGFFQMMEAIRSRKYEVGSMK